MHDLVRALLLSAGMFRDVFWSLVLGFTISGLVQALVPTEGMRRALGREGAREIALATLFGAASSSCSYASAAVSRSLFKRGAGLVPSLAFLFASTNLVIELGIVLLLLLGWVFTAAEWIGGLVLVVVMAVLVRLTCPRGLAEQARRHPETGQGHEHQSMPVAGDTLWSRLRNPALAARVAQSFAMDVSMLWKDIALGFLIAGALGAVVPGPWWSAVFLHGATPPVRAVGDALIGPLVAVLSFVCSIGNVPLAAILWNRGIGFGGVIAFLYADLIVLPLLDVYRRYYGWRMAAYIAAVFYATMVLSALLMDGLFHLAGIVPTPAGHFATGLTHWRLDATVWLDLGFGALAAAFFVTARRHAHGSSHGHEHSHGH